MTDNDPPSLDDLLTTPHDPFNPTPGSPCTRCDEVAAHWKATTPIRLRIGNDDPLLVGTIHTDPTHTQRRRAGWRVLGYAIRMILGLQTQHDPTRACDDLHCFWHNKDEQVPRWWPLSPWYKDGYLACMECSHLYKTPLHLVAAYAWRYWTLGGDLRDRIRIRLPRQIHHCPHCAHDF